ncbi:MAG TPA: MXAN_5187 family protein [Kofleriaceae bacterium]|nr:MXAN_5187 family protein [Kofleriaceae bacterium]
MFWSKIWLFIVAALGAVAVTVALLLPRPAERARVAEERDRLVVACDVVNILLRDAARVQVDVAGVFARTPSVVSALEQASAADAITEDKAKAARQIAGDTIAAVSGTRPDFAILIDRKGRVLTRAGIDEDAFGDTMAGRFLVDDALDGLLRDDLWFTGGRLYRVAASPVVHRDAPASYVGAVVIGNAVSKELAESLVSPLGAKIGFFADGHLIVSSTADVLDHDLLAAYQPLAASRGDLEGDCRARPPVTARSGKTEYTALVARLPGEARSADAFYGVYLERPKALGLAGTLDAVRKDDMSFAHFPWAPVAIGFLVVLAIGIALMILEADRPIRRLQADAVALGSGKVERLPEERGGRVGSVARSVNIRIDKMGRELKSARRNLDQLLGPGGEESLDDDAAAIAAMPDAPRRPPPPAEFKFSSPSMTAPPMSAGPSSSSSSSSLELGGPARGGSGPSIATPGMTPASSSPGLAAGPGGRAQRAPIAMPSSASGPAMTPPAARAPEPVSAPIATPPPAALEDDILSMPASPSLDGDEDPYFRSVFNEFVAMKKHCGEPVAGLTYARFAEKLRRNRDDLMAKPGCIDVRFSVYVKDGKAALKATPVKDA